MTITNEDYPDIYDDNPPVTYKDAADKSKKIQEYQTKQKRFYLATRHVLRATLNFDAGGSTTPDPSSFPNGYGTTSGESPSDAHKFVRREKVVFVSVIGRLIMGGWSDASNGRQANKTLGPNDEIVRGTELSEDFPQLADEDWGTEPDDPTKPFEVALAPEFKVAVAEAFQHLSRYEAFYDQALRLLRKRGTGKANGSGGSSTTIYARQIAQVASRLATSNVKQSDPQIQAHVANAIDMVLGGVVEAHPSMVEIELPDLDAGATVEIIRDNVLATQAIYWSAQLEELKLHAAMDQIVDHFSTGMLPITRGGAGDRIYKWIKGAPERMTELERRSVYGRVLGIAQGTADVAPNREFSELWFRFLSTVSQKFREISSFERDEVSLEQVHKSARDLAVNLSLHGYAIAHPAAVEMQSIVKDILGVFDEPELHIAYGVRDRWQLVDRVSNLYLGGSVNGVKFRTMAVAGQRIINWIADKNTILQSGSASGLNIVEWVGDRRKATDDFRALVDLAERWLAVTGTPDAAVAQSTDPVDLPQQHTVPMLGQSAAMPPSVQEALEQVGASVPNLPVIPQA